MKGNGVSDNALMKLEQAHALLAEVKEAPDAKGIADLAAAAKTYARKHQLGVEVVNYAHTVRIDALAKMYECCEGRLVYGTRGQLNGKDASGSSILVLPEIKITLAELGIGKKESADGGFLLKIQRERPDLYSSVRSNTLSISAARKELSVPKPSKFDLSTEAEAILKFLQERREGWPEEHRHMFLGLVHRAAQRMEAMDRVDRRQGLGSTQAG